MALRKKRSLGQKLFISYLLAGMIPAIIVAAACYYRTVEEQKVIIAESLSAYMNAIDNISKLEQNNLLLMAKTLSGDSRTRESLADNNLQSMQPHLDFMLKQAQRADYLFIVDGEGKVLAESLTTRAREQGVNPEKFRTKTIGKESVSLRSNDRGDGIDIRASSPIQDTRGNIIGTVLTGATISSDNFVDGIKNTFGIEFTIFRDDIRVATSLVNNGSRAIGTKLTNETISSNVLRNKGVFQDMASIFNKRYFTAYWPIQNEEGRCIGMFFLGMPTAAVDKSNMFLLELVLGILVVTAVALILVSLGITRSITKPINAAVTMLVNSSAEVATASDNIAESCQRLAGASNEQANDMSMSTTALEELTGFAKQNADNTRDAEKLMGQTRSSANEANGLMSELVQAMEAIQSSSQRVSGVIKSIEDISFQTNLLALNAAVEAARAGEHGKGFAVVADEVRNLAQRAAEAARSTTDIIGESVEQTRVGVEKANISASSIGAILDGTDKVAGMLTNIETASSEQSTGISHLSDTVSHMDVIHRDIVDNSNEAAHSAENLAAQSRRLDEVINELSDLIGTKTNATPRTKRKKAAPAIPAQKKTRKLLGYSKSA